MTSPKNAAMTYVPKNQPERRPQEIQMKNYTEPRNQPDERKSTDVNRYERQPNYQNPEHAKEEPSNCNYCLSLVVFISAIGVNLAIWAIDYIVIGYQSSNYYSTNYTISTTVDAVTYTDSTQMFATVSVNSTLSVAMSLVYSWVLWKFPLIVYSYNLIEKREEGKGIKYGSFLALLIILLAIDILLSAFVLHSYNEYIYYGIYVILTLLVAIINNSGLNRTKEAACNTLIPLMQIAFLYVCYCLFLPTLYNIYYTNLSNMGAIFLLIYGYPVVDLLLYALTLFLGTKVDPSVRSFYATLHFLMIGYGVGMILIVGYTEVQFYYLLGYFIFKNIFVNWIMRNWQKVVNNPPILPGWGILYYVGYGFSFLPIIGVGKLVVAKSFMSYIFARTSTLLYSLSNPLYPSSIYSATTLSYNASLNGNIYWLAGCIIWIAMTLSQRYDRRKPNLYDFFYYLFGIHLFYMGIASSLSVYELATRANLK